VEKAAKVETVKPTPPPKPQIKKILVKKGEWLYEIARKEYGNSQSWKKIYEANKKLIDNPDMIYPNQEFIIPE
jgi:nucleoid-associated protein YgaU